MADGGKLMAKMSLSWKKSFSSGCCNSAKKKNCGDCEIDSLCGRCDKLGNQRQEFSANLNERKREPPNNIGHLLPKYIST